MKNLDANLQSRLRAEARWMATLAGEDEFAASGPKGEIKVAPQFSTPPEPLRFLRWLPSRLLPWRRYEEVAHKHEV